jgi:hypothetical protein
MSQPSKTISYRLPQPFLKELFERAAINDESPGTWTRRIIIDALSNRSEEELSEIRRAIDELRQDLSLVAKALLVRAGKAEIKEADEWVRKNLH